MSGADHDALRRLAERIAELLRATGQTLALAESCTGGLIAATITAVAGASEFLWGGAVVYSAEAKVGLTGVDPGVIARQGTVSAATSEALAEAVRLRAGATFGLAVTGWAGPTAGDGAAGEDGVVGDVHGSLSHAGGTTTASWHIDGDREAVRVGAARATLELLRRHLEDAQDGRHD